jgi:hypothetical protein
MEQSWSEVRLPICILLATMFDESRPSSRLRLVWGSMGSFRTHSRKPPYEITMTTPTKTATGEIYRSKAITTPARFEMPLPKLRDVIVCDYCKQGWVPSHTGDARRPEQHDTYRDEYQEYRNTSAV